MPKGHAVKGHVQLPQADLPRKAAKIIVQIEDVSRADAPSKVIGEQKIENVSLDAGKTIPFRIVLPDDAVDPQSHYSVRVHIDVEGTGTVDRGDFVSTQSYPVLTRGFGNDADMQVTKV